MLCARWHGRQGCASRCSVHAPVAFRPDNAEWASSRAGRRRARARRQPRGPHRGAQGRGLLLRGRDALPVPAARRGRATADAARGDGLRGGAGRHGVGEPLRRHRRRRERLHLWRSRAADRPARPLRRLRPAGARETRRSGSALDSAALRAGRHGVQLERLWAELAERRRRPSAEAHRQTSQRGSATS